jgi:predicted outer membrane lipoprotein
MANFCWEYDGIWENTSYNYRVISNRGKHLEIMGATMNTFLWILQILLAVAFAMTGALKLMQTKEQLGVQMKWVESYSPGFIRFLGVAELLGAAGLILPGLTGILPWLTPLAATGLVLDMIGASVTHFRLKEYQSVGITAALGILAALVAVGRFWISPL